jgi:hypothetical protein
MQTGSAARAEESCNDGQVAMAARASSWGSSGRKFVEDGGAMSMSRAFEC